MDTNFNEDTTNESASVACRLRKLGSQKEWRSTSWHLWHGEVFTTLFSLLFGLTTTFFFLFLLFDAVCLRRFGAAAMLSLFDVVTDLFDRQCQHRFQLASLLCWTFIIEMISSRICACIYGVFCGGVAQRRHDTHCRLRLLETAVLLQRSALRQLPTSESKQPRSRSVRDVRLVSFDILV